MIKSGTIVLKGVNLVHNDKIRYNGLERSQFSTQWYNQVQFSWNKPTGHTMIKSGQMVLKGVNWVPNDKIW